MPVEVQSRPDLDAVALRNASGRLACAIVALLGLGSGVPGLPVRSRIAAGGPSCV